MRPLALKNLDRIFESFMFHTEDIEDVLNKEWLITALISTIKKDVDLPEEIVRRAINLLYLSEDA